VVVGIAQAQGELQLFGSLPVQLAEDGLGLGGQAVMAGGPGAFRVGGCAEDRRVQRRIALDEEVSGGSGAGVLFVVIIGAGDPLQGRVIGRRDVDLVAVPLRILEIVVDVVGIDRLRGAIDRRATRREQVATVPQIEPGASGIW